MTTCSMSGCRNEGSLLLHIRNKKENLVQAEYCPPHFCSMAQQWKEDIELADIVKSLYYFNGDYDYGHQDRDIQGGIRFLWWLKDNSDLTENPTRDEILKVFEMHQTAAMKKIVQRAKDGSHDAVIFCRKHHIPIQEYPSEQKKDLNELFTD